MFNCRKFIWQCAIILLSIQLFGLRVSCGGEIGNGNRTVDVTVTADDSPASDSFDATALDTDTLSAFPDPEEAAQQILGSFGPILEASETEPFSTLNSKGPAPFQLPVEDFNSIAADGISSGDPTKFFAPPKYADQVVQGYSVPSQLPVEKYGSIASEGDSSAFEANPTKAFNPQKYAEQAVEYSSLSPAGGQNFPNFQQFQKKFPLPQNYYQSRTVQTYPAQTYQSSSISNVGKSKYGFSPRAAFANIDTYQHEFENVKNEQAYPTETTLTNIGKKRLQQTRDLKKSIGDLIKDQADDVNGEKAFIICTYAKLQVLISNMLTTFSSDFSHFAKLDAGIDLDSCRVSSYRSFRKFEDSLTEVHRTLQEYQKDEENPATKTLAALHGLVSEGITQISGKVNEYKSQVESAKE